MKSCLRQADFTAGCGKHRRRITLFNRGGRYYEAVFLHAPYDISLRAGGVGGVSCGGNYVLSDLVSAADFAAERGGQLFTEQPGQWNLARRLFLGIYFLFQVLIQNGKERLQFGLEKKVTLALGTHIAETVHSLDYPHFESETMYDLVEKISDKPYEHFWKAFYSFSKVIGILLQLIAVFGYLLYLSGGGVGVSVVLIVLISILTTKSW